MHHRRSACTQAGRTSTVTLVRIREREMHRHVSRASANRGRPCKVIKHMQHARHFRPIYAGQRKVNFPRASPESSGPSRERQSSSCCVRDSGLPWQISLSHCTVTCSASTSGSGSSNTGVEPYKGIKQCLEYPSHPFWQPLSVTTTLNSPARKWGHRYGLPISRPQTVDGSKRS